MRTCIWGLSPAELSDELEAVGEPPYRARQVMAWAYKEGAHDFHSMTNLSNELRAHLDQTYELALPEVVRVQEAADSLTRKALLRLSDGETVETVLMQYAARPDSRERATVCVSTQAGCAMGCVFCATGQMGFQRNLRAEEVVAQVMHFARLLRERGQHVTNVVFMGMGEPLANYAETIRAVRLLTDPRAFGRGQRNITISTVGVIHGIERLAREGLQVGLAISLHAPNEELRQRLVPTAGPHSVEALMRAAEDYFRASGRRVTFEYALIDGVNDSPALAAELAALLSGTGTHVNLIPVNPTAGGFGRPERARTLAFERILRAAGVNCTVRVEKGSEISAACGQLRTDAAPAGEDVLPTVSPGGPKPGPRQEAPSQAPSRPQ